MEPFNWMRDSIALPEIFMMVMALIVLVGGVFARPLVAPATAGIMTRLSLLGAAFLTFYGWSLAPHETLTAFPRLANGAGALYVQDGLSTFAKLIMLGAGFFALFLPAEFLNRKGADKFEYYPLVMLSLLGMMIMVSAADLLTLYIGLEMMSLSLYILAAFQTNDAKSSEAALKYFVLGALASGLLLYGGSLLYGATGTTSLTGIQAILSPTFFGVAAGEQTVILSFAMVLLLTGLLFKISAAPFHMWTPDVYEGAPTPVTAFMASAPKAAAMVALIRILQEPLAGFVAHTHLILTAIAILTMAIGAVLAILQENIKRMMAYSSIGHVGYMLVGLAAGTPEGTQAVLAYLPVYMMMTLGVFAALLMLRKQGVFAETVKDLSGLSKTHPWTAFALMLLMLSLAGVPPLAGFFVKFGVFAAAVKAGLIPLAVTGVIFSVVAAYYPLRLVKTMYFDAPPAKEAFESTTPVRVAIVLLLATLATIGLGLFPDLLAHFVLQFTA